MHGRTAVEMAGLVSFLMLMACGRTLAAGMDLLVTNAAWTAESDHAGAEFGASVANAGDVNGDGYADVIIGAVEYDNGHGPEGRAFVYHGSAAGLAATPAWTADGHQAGAAFGQSVATAGDVNGDGYADVIVGATFYDNDQEVEGRVFVYHGSAAGLGATPAWTAESNQFSQFGYSVGAAGDVNGDGFSDVVVGAWQYTNGQPSEGKVVVYHGSRTGLGATPAWTAETNGFEAHFGFSVATAGDVNGDGFADVIVGKENNGDGQARAYVYHGSASGLGAAPVWTADGGGPGAGDFGWSVATAGDVNGDGYADVIVGSQTVSSPQNHEGKAFVYHGSATGLGSTPAWTAEGEKNLAKLGYSVGTAGDVNGDGYADVIVGAPFYNNGQLDEGRAFVYLGSATGLAGHAAWTAESDQVSARLGYSVGTAGDVNGDGYADVVAGAPYYDGGETDEGRAFVYHGSAAGVDAAPAGRADGLLVAKTGGPAVMLNWDPSCRATDTDYGIYEGLVGDFYSHELRLCGTGGSTTSTFLPLAGNAYYLVVPHNATREGSYGTDSDAMERPAALPACLPQAVGICP